MIEKMKKITFLVSDREKDLFLAVLRKEGVIHIKQIKEPAGTKSLTLTEKQLSWVDKAITVLSSYGGTATIRDKTKWNEQAYIDTAKKILAYSLEKKQFEHNIQNLEKEREWFEKWGEADPGEIISLRMQGTYIRLYRIRTRDLKKVENRKDVRTIREEKGTAYLALVTRDPEVKLPFEETALPARSWEEYAAEIKKLSDGAAGAETFLREQAKEGIPLNKFKKILEKRKEFLSVKFGMREEGTFSCLQGFCPAKEAERVVSLAKDSGTGYFMEEPDDPGETPTLITNPRWIDVIRPVFKFMNTVPGYGEYDISFVFLVFFSLFFAMLVGDAGYGILFAVITFLVRKKAGTLPKQPFFLMYLLSGATIVWGAVTGTWFGSEAIARLPFFNSLIIGNIDSFVDTNQNFLIFFCFVIGAVHLTIAHITKGIRLINSPVCLAQAGWISIVWGMFYTAGTLVIARPFPRFAGYLLGTGILLVLVFANFRKNIFKGMAQTLVDLPLSVIGAFSDIVSYLRLFAVGYATVVVAESFNEMALGSGVHSVPGGVIAAFILFFGHALNIILALMAVIVHGIRLNMLEFSGHLGMQWTGREYKPFAE